MLVSRPGLALDNTVTLLIFTEAGHEGAQWEEEDAARVGRILDIQLHQVWGVISWNLLLYCAVMIRGDYDGAPLDKVLFLLQSQAAANNLGQA